MDVDEDFFGVVATGEEGDDSEYMLELEDVDEVEEMELDLELRPNVGDRREHGEDGDVRAKVYDIVAEVGVEGIEDCTSVSLRERAVEILEASKGTISLHCCFHSSYDAFCIPTHKPYRSNAELIQYHYVGLLLCSQTQMLLKHERTIPESNGNRPMMIDLWVPFSLIDPASVLLGEVPPSC